MSESQRNPRVEAVVVAVAAAVAVVNVGLVGECCSGDDGGEVECSLLDGRYSEPTEVSSGILRAKFLVGTFRKDDAESRFEVEGWTWRSASALLLL